MSGPDTEVDMKEVELNEGEQEKLPINSGPGPAEPGTNGAVMVMVKVKVEPEAEHSFTGLSKEELLREASTPAWARTRCLLLLLFWLGWLGMLAGAVVIIVQAPRCKPLPPLRWWQEGGVYQVAVEAFQDTDQDRRGDLAGVRERMEEIAALKVKALVIGPIHHNTPDMVNETRLTEIDSSFGNLEQLEKLMETARRKGIKLILDLTPNYKGKQEWFGINFTGSDGRQDLLQEKEAFQYWLQKGVDGLRLGGIEQVLHSLPARVDEWQNLTKNFSTDEKPRVLIVATAMSNSTDILQLLNQSDTDVLFSFYLREMLRKPTGNTARQMVENYTNHCGTTWPSWAVGGYEVGHVAPMVEENLRGLVQILLFTLPGTPFIYYGDEIGLQDPPGELNKTPWMLWNSSANGGFTSKFSQEDGPALNLTVEGQKSDKRSLLSLFKKLNLLKIKEHSLQFGDFQSVHSSEHVYAYTRSWDQSTRFLVLLNFGEEMETVSITETALLGEASVELSSSAERPEGVVSLDAISLAGGEGLVLKIRFVA